MILGLWLCWILPFLAINQIPQISTLQLEENLNSVEEQPIENQKDDNDKGKSSYLWPKFPIPVDFPEPAPEQRDKTTPKPKHGSKHQEHGHSKAVKLLRSSLNQSVDPCDDFYEFTCGKWLANNPMPAGAKFNSHFIQLYNKSRHQLQGLLVDPKPSASSAINMAKSFFNACMNYDQKQPSPLLKKINELCGWPILQGSEWDPECFNLPHILAKITRTLAQSCPFSYIFMEPVVLQNRFNASQQTIYFHESGLGLGNAEAYRDEIKLEEYVQQITHIVKVLASDAGIEFCDEKVSHEVNKIVEFEKKLANITTPFKTYQEKMAHFKLRKYSNLTKLFPEIKEYFKTLLPIKESFHKYFASDPQVFATDFPERLGQLLRSTNKTILANYVMMRFAKRWADNDLDNRLKLETKKGQTVDSKDMQCIQAMGQFMPYPAGALYVRKYFDNGTKMAVSEMVGNIRSTFRKMLDQAAWMDPVTKKRAIGKLAKVKPQIGFPEFLLNDTALDAYHEELNFDDDDTYSTMVGKASIFKTTKTYEKLLAPSDPNEFSYPAYLAFTFFKASTNNIYLSAGILQAPFYDKSIPMAMNYGGIGNLIGREFARGFDDETGSHYDETGAESDWWEPATKTNFAKPKQCIIDKYSGYRVPEMNMTVNGTRTASQNIADNAGIKEAYLAYQAYLKELGDEKENRVPSFGKFTNEQLFFISNGLTGCGKLTDEMLKMQLSRWNQSPNRYRVNGPLQNLPEFAEAFNCPKGSPMNPKKKCQVW